MLSEACCPHADLANKPDLLLTLLTDMHILTVSFKTLGLLPGSVTQAGRFDAAGSIIRVSAMCSFLWTFQEAGRMSMHTQRRIAAQVARQVATMQAVPGQERHLCEVLGAA